MPILTGLIALTMVRAIRKERNSKPFWLAIALFFDNAFPGARYMRGLFLAAWSIFAEQRGSAQA